MSKKPSPDTIYFLVSELKKINEDDYKRYGRRFPVKRTFLYEGIGYQVTNEIFSVNGRFCYKCKKRQGGWKKYMGANSCAPSPSAIIVPRKGFNITFVGNPSNKNANNQRYYSVDEWKKKHPLDSDNVGIKKTNPKKDNRIDLSRVIQSIKRDDGMNVEEKEFRIQNVINLLKKSKKRKVYVQQSKPKISIISIPMGGKPK